MIIKISKQKKYQNSMLIFYVWFKAKKSLNIINHVQNLCIKFKNKKTIWI